MVKFFRRIRKMLLDQGNLKKYLIYALGEVMLVVIGILLALQINNWNQTRVSKKTEKAILTRIIEDLEMDHLQFKLLDSIYQGASEDNNAFMELIKKTSLSGKDLLMLRSYVPMSPREINPRFATYEEMLNSGKIYELSDEALANGIMEYYRHLRDAEQDVSDYSHQFFDFWNSPNLINFWHIKNIDDDPEKIQDLVEALLMDKNKDDYKYLLNAITKGQRLISRNLRIAGRLEKLNLELSESIRDFLHEEWPR